MAVGFPQRICAISEHSIKPILTVSRRFATSEVAIWQPWNIIGNQSLWDREYYRIWLPGSNKTVRISASSLEPISETPSLTTEGITYAAYATRVADTLTQDILLAPVE